MPVIAAIGGFLGTTGGAAIASAGVGALGSVLASNNASDAAQSAANTQASATQAQLALQQQQYNQTRSDQQPYMQAGYSALNALMGKYGLNQQAQPVVANGNMAPGGQPQTSPLQSGGQPSGGYTQNPGDAAYFQANPDIAAEAQRVVSVGAFPNVDAYLQWHDQQYANENRPSPATTSPVVQAAPQTGEQQLAQQVGQAPNPGPDPSQSQTPFQFQQRQGFIAPDVSTNAFTASPDYNFRLQQGSRNLNAFNAAKGVLGSGAAMKDLIDYGQNTAASEYGNWRNYVTGQANTQNAFNQQNYNYDTSAQQSQYNTDRGFNQTAYDNNRQFNQNVFDTNRSYDASRADATTNNLFRIASGGQGGIAASSAAGQNYANNSGNAIQNGANAQANYYGQQATSQNQLIGSLAGAGQSLLNSYGSGSPYGAVTPTSAASSYGSSAYQPAPGRTPITQASFIPYPSFG